MTYRRLCLLNKCLFGLDSAGGASVLASTAVDAGIGIYNVLIGALGNSGHGANSGACTAAYAFIGNNVCHWLVPPKIF